VFEALKRWWKSEESVDDGARGPLPDDFPGDWVVLPYRIAEACRISMYTVGSHPELPAELSWWIGQWLEQYNASLARYFSEVYGPDIFPVLERITASVKEVSEKFYTEEFNEELHKSFKAWEEELNGRGDGNPPPATPPAG
jgi:hypothetical protein